jgi:sortase A
MDRALSLVGTVLVLAGLALLAYVGVSYAHTSSPAQHIWSPAERRAGHQLAARLTGQRTARAPRQTVSVPRRMSHRVVEAAGSQPALRMVIPRIAVDAPVVQTAPVNGVWDVADWSVGHLTTSPDPGAPGNGAYAAHDDIKGELFKRLDELKPGDAVLLYTRHTVYRYVVTEQQTVDPSDVSVLSPTRAPTVTLISCTPYWVDTQRLIVQAVLKSRAAA